MNLCLFDRAWIGPCGRDANEDFLCSSHAHLRCVSCGAKATRECDHTGIQFVCGYPLCDECEHQIPEKGKEGLFMLGGGHKKKSEVAK